MCALVLAGTVSHGAAKHQASCCLAFWKLLFENSDSETQCGTLQQRTKHHVFRSGGHNFKTLTRMLSWNGKWVFWSWWGHIIWQRMRFRSMNAYLICLGFFFFLSFCMCLKRKQDGQCFSCLLVKELGTTREDRATDESWCPLTWDISTLPVDFSFQ